MTTPSTPLGAPGAPKKRRRTWLYVVGALAVVVVVAAGVIAAVVALRPSMEDRATEVCQKNVREKLKSPSTAEFVGEVTVIVDGGDYYRVAGEVDGQNSFGATIRNRYGCYMKFQGETSWRVLESTVTAR